MVSVGNISWRVWRPLAGVPGAGAPWYAYRVVAALTILLLWITFVPLRQQAAVAAGTEPC